MKICNMEILWITILLIVYFYSISGESIDSGKARTIQFDNSMLFGKNALFSPTFHQVISTNFFGIFFAGITGRFNGSLK